MKKQDNMARTTFQAQYFMSGFSLPAQDVVAVVQSPVSLVVGISLVASRSEPDLLF
jgi:hypothetical protein